MLTVHERLTARKVLICPPYCRASARKSRCALWLRRAKRICKRHSGLHFRRNQSPHSTIRPTSAIPHPQNPSGADRNPIGRGPRPSQTPATYFKRPYRNCPGEESCAQSRLIGQGSPDRDLSLVGTNPENAANCSIGRRSRGNSAIVTGNPSDLKYRAVEVECGGARPIRRTVPLCFYNNWSSLL